MLQWSNPASIDHVRSYNLFEDGSDLKWLREIFRSFVDAVYDKTEKFETYSCKKLLFNYVLNVFFLNYLF